MRGTMGSTVSKAWDRLGRNAVAHWLLAFEILMHAASAPMYPPRNPETANAIASSNTR